MRIECFKVKTFYKTGFLLILLSIVLWIPGCIGGDVDKTPTPDVTPVKSVTPFPQDNGGIKWLSSIDEGRAEACKSKKLLMLHFYTTWGDWSIKMDKETYTYYKVIDLTKNFVCVRIDLDLHPELEESYNISGHPTVIFEDPFTGKEVKRIEGIRDRHEMTDELESMLSYKIKTNGGN